MRLYNCNFFVGYSFKLIPLSPSQLMMPNVIGDGENINRLSLFTVVLGTNKTVKAWGR